MFWIDFCKLTLQLNPAIFLRNSFQLFRQIERKVGKGISHRGQPILSPVLSS
jgi:hypothetical protein